MRGHMTGQVKLTGTGSTRSKDWYNAVFFPREVILQNSIQNGI